ncbi:hypothetical protein CYLTODRAFT_454759 [Cylindrobasidium torrendii FP15055 ss-10]|uniref:DUF6593 domain-containing protein n=1 Tax=Cylindrobasidium torrendii FP15055 ss-10 TaxID=1314674 RepID=A0A0D7BC90_9AGAR|nr:hypothetical protein CYLTODRAFT_454759 [Cylindrobasidium torrendii FP15055 ss-10]
MDLRFTDDSADNTIILLPDDTPAYFVETEHKFLVHSRTVIKKTHADTITEMGSVKLSSMLDDGFVNVWGRNITPQSTGMFSASRTFVASDGKSYKWKVEMGSPLYLISTGNHHTVASYDRGSLGFFGKARLPSLSVTPEGMPIGDDIIGTFVFMRLDEERRRRRRRR